MAYLQIAGVTLSLTCDQSIQLQGLDPAYASFVGRTAQGEGALKIRIRLQLEGNPGIEHLTKIFDTGESWAMYRRGDEYWLIYNPRHYESPFWMARFDQKADEVCVYCNPQFALKKGGKTILDNPVCYPLDQLLLMYFLARHQGLLVHAAGMGIKGRGIIFPGPSGAGKSTLSRQFALRKKRGILSDERMVIRKIKGDFVTFGTPWPGTERIAKNKGLSLSGIFFLGHGKSNRIKEVKPEDALERLLPVCSIPWYDHEVMSLLILFCKEVIAHVPAYELCFKPDHDVVDFIEKIVYS